ncbi:MAG: translation initiation factor IF-3 [Chloroflexi bacterium]|nr:translation initiation factor IF-3 [Chloroflexota bacterium]
MVKPLRINQRIRAAEVRVVGEKGEQLGIMSLAQALDLARKSNLDLVEVAPTAVPPVCRLLDYGKFKYEQTKKEKQARRSQKLALLREVRLRPKIGDHDFDAKLRNIRKLLSGGDKVKVTIWFRGREITHPDIGWKLLQRVTEAIKDQAGIDRQPTMEGKRMSIILTSFPAQKSRPKEEVKLEEVKETKEEVKKES